MREYVKIYCCGDCVHYDWKKHKCKRGAHVEGRADQSFFRDCPEKIHVEDENKQLTWNEIVCMLGKPIWVEFAMIGDPEWVVVTKDFIENPLFKSNYDRLWKAYRNEIHE